MRDPIMTPEEMLAAAQALRYHYDGTEAPEGQHEKNLATAAKLEAAAKEAVCLQAPMDLEEAVEVFTNRSNGGGSFDRDGTLQVSLGKGGRVWIDGEYTIEELEAAVVISKHKYYVQRGILPFGRVPKGKETVLHLQSNCETAQDLFALLQKIPEHIRRDLGIEVIADESVEGNITHVEAVRDREDDGCGGLVEFLRISSSLS